MTARAIYCCGCRKEVQARLTDGREIYPHRPDLHGKPFWRCDGCNGYVGCHHRSQNRTKPLGCIPTPEIKAARNEVHRVIDPLWQSGLINRSALYRRIGAAIGMDEYHTAEIRSVEQAHEVITAAGAIEVELRAAEKTTEASHA